MELFFIAFLLTLLVVYSASKPEVSILIMSQQTGYLKASSININTNFLVKFWQQHLYDKALNDPTWPFNASIELHDCRCDNDYTRTFLDNRFRNASLPPITIMAGPEYKPLSPSVVRFASAHNIPYVFHISMDDFPRPAVRNTTFSVVPPTMYINTEVINAYVDHGVKSLVAVVTLGFPLNIDACFGTAAYAKTRGISVLAQYSLTLDMTRSEVFNVVQDIRDKHGPDAILWCDYY
eukprot:gene7497-15342_t